MTDSIFVVGLSRSGTTLLRNVLNQHGSIAIAPENHYLGHLLGREGVRQKLRRFGEAPDDERLRELVDFLYDGGLRRSSRLREPSRFWTWVEKRQPRDELYRRLAATDRSERAVFTTLLDLYAERKGKRIRGEKTPAHLRYVPTLMEWFPSGRVIHMMRDPRGIFVSEQRRRRSVGGGLPYRVVRRVPPLLTGFVLVETTLIWAESAWRSARYRRAYPDRYRMLRFEDLVRTPEEELRGLCRWLGVDYQPAMLDQRVVSVGSRLGERGFDAGAASRWRDFLPRWADTWFRTLLGAWMTKFGYGEPE